MLVQTVPDTLTKLAQLGNTTNFEPSGNQPKVEHKRVPYQSRSLDECITNVVTPIGKKPVLKAMMTTAYERNCFYSPFRATTVDVMKADRRLLLRVPGIVPVEAEVILSVRRLGRRTN